MLGGLFSGLSGKLLWELAPGWTLEMETGPGPGSPKGRGANLGQGNMGIDETGGPMGAQANKGQRSMILDEPGGPMVEQPPQMRTSRGRSRQEGIMQDEGFLYTDFQFIALTSSRANEGFPRIQRHSDTAKEVPALDL